MPIPKVAIQGALGAFHEEAANLYFAGTEIEIVPCDTFPEVIKSVETGESDFAMMAIENTVAGSILPNYALLQESELEIAGEYYMRIVQNLMAMKGSRIEDLVEVYSHPMAIYQSRKFFRNYPKIRLIESVDTAISARDVRDSGEPTRGAIGSESAALRYGLQIVAAGVEDNKQNYTRFFALRRKHALQQITPEVNKASLCFSLPHTAGSLSAILSIFTFYGLNLHKIQSHPILGQPGQYLFHVDLVFSDYGRYRQCLQAIRPLTESVQIFGEYKEGYQSFRDIHSQKG